jgi:hypothetical protein
LSLHDNVAAACTIIPRTLPVSALRISTPVDFSYGRSDNTHLALNESVKSLVADTQIASGVPDTALCNREPGVTTIERHRRNALAQPMREVPQGAGQPIIVWSCHDVLNS